MISKLKITGIIALTSLLSITSLAANDLVHKARTAGPGKIWPTIRLVEGADLANFREAYEKTREEQREKYVEQAEKLMKAGAAGAEAAQMLMDFDKHILALREHGKARLGITLEASVKANLDKLYRVYQPPERKLQFYNKQNTYSGYDYFIYGVYSVKNVGGPGLQLTITLVDLRSGEEQSFEASAPEVTAGQVVARMLFDAFQKTEYPSKIKILGRNLTLLTKGTIELEDGYTSPISELYQSATDVCSAYGGRNIRERELKTLMGLGDYRGGITIAKAGGEESHYWAIDLGNVLISYQGVKLPADQMNSASYMNYVCVK